MQRELKMAAGLLLAAAAIQCGGNTSGVPEFQPVATVDQVMDAVIIPASEAIFDAVVYSNGELVQAPASDDDWFRLQMQGIALAEAGNLLLMPPRARDTGNWTAFSRAMTERAVQVVEAAEARNLDQLLEAGSRLYESCTACHAQYLPQE